MNRQTDRRTDGRTDRQGYSYIPPPPQKKKKQKNKKKLCLRGYNYVSIENVTFLCESVSDIVIMLQSFFMLEMQADPSYHAFTCNELIIIVISCLSYSTWLLLDFCTVLPVLEQGPSTVRIAHAHALCIHVLVNLWLMLVFSINIQNKIKIHVYLSGIISTIFQN